MKRVLLIGLAAVVRASEHVFSVQDDVLAYPQVVMLTILPYIGTKAPLV